MEEQRRIVAIHDISGLGKCSLTVVLPVISATGVECACIPTALLSTHTGEFEGYTFKDLSDEILPIARHWQSFGARFDGIYSGYLASAQQAETLMQVIDILANEETKIIVDPVMADNGSYYSKHGNEMCCAFRKLCGRADVITPNITEAALLTGLPYNAGPHSEEYIAKLMASLSKICHGIIAITGVCTEDGRVGVTAFDPKTGETFTVNRPYEHGHFYGTGDIFASAFSALLVRGADLKSATETAVALVGDCIIRTVKHKTPRRFGVDFETALPAYISKVDELIPE